MGRGRGRGRGRHIDPEARQQIIELVEEAVANGCRKEVACRDLEIPSRTVQRWQKAPDLDDKRKSRKFEPTNKLKPEERANILRLVNSKEFRDLPPSQIVPTLLDRHEYYASESTIYRILHEEKMVAHRGRQRSPKRHRPKAFAATGPNQIWTWDITYLPAPVKGEYFYLYMIMDIFSRKIVGLAIHNEESAEHSAVLIEKTCRAEGVVKSNLVLHSDNGGPMKGVTMLTKLQDLGVVPSFSRPSVSNDNPFSESLFRTLKYRPDYPDKRFASLTDAQQWVKLFVRWYNYQHKHSALKWVTPHQRHTGIDAQIRESRHLVLEKARMVNPGRWSRSVRSFDLEEKVYLNAPKCKAGGERVAS